MELSLDEVRNQIQSAEQILKRLDMEMENVQFDPLVPSSVEEAIATVYQMIEGLLMPFKANPVLGPLTEELKSQYLDGILTQVSEAQNAASQPKPLI